MSAKSLGFIAISCLAFAATQASAQRPSQTEGGQEQTLRERARARLNQVTAVKNEVKTRAKAAVKSKAERLREKAEALQQAYRDVNENPLLKGYHDRQDHRSNPDASQDEAMQAWKAGPNSMSQADKNALWNGSCTYGQCDDYFQDMDYGITRNENLDDLQAKLAPFAPGVSKGELAHRVARGRNNWIVWSGGNDRFWDFMTQATLGSFDLIKTISNHTTLGARRSNRWQTLGLVNEPCFKSPTKADEYGLWLDERDNSLPGCKPDPFEDELKYPGIKIGARGTTVPRGSFYGKASGVVGLRLLPNPAFDEAAKAAWDPVRYYNDASYYNNPKLVRPYRVGMACAFCHVGPNPSKPPKDFNNPAWENLNANAGAQYFWVDKIFYWDWARTGEKNFIYQLLRTSRPGALDTSLVSSDQINNPRTMNAVYDLPARMTVAKMMGHQESLTTKSPTDKGEQGNKQFNMLGKHMVPNGSMLNEFFSSDSKMGTMTTVTPRVLKDGSDSVGALGALNRVYINIGLFSEEWTQLFIPLVGGMTISPFRIAQAERGSLYWQTNVNQTPDVGLFFLAASRPDKLAVAPHQASELKSITDQTVVRGKLAFANHCARCHTSKLPDSLQTKVQEIFAATPGGKPCHGKDYMQCWDKYWTFSQTPEFKQSMQAFVASGEFLKDNFLSNDQRVPVTLLDSNLCSPIAMNGVKDNIWDNFSSTSYKSLGSVGQFTVSYPSGEGEALVNESYRVPDGGRGFLRPASLISVWATAPLLTNNSLGKFDYYGTVAGRLRSFDDSIRKLLLLSPRGSGQAREDRDARSRDLRDGEKVVTYRTQTGDELKGIMDVTTDDSFLRLPKSYIPSPIRWAIEASLGTPLPEMLELGPIPKGVPVNLISNLDLGNGMSALQKGENAISLGRTLVGMVRATAEIKSKNLKGEEARKAFMRLASPGLLSANKCKDFVVNRGHYFGTGLAPDVKAGTAEALSPADREALIEFIKHM